MFTGLIQDVGKVIEIEKRGDWRFTVESKLDMARIAVGDSVACSGVCLTVIEKSGNCFAADVSAETMDKTTLKSWKKGDLINLEPSLRIGDQLGGHLVYGHVDAIIPITGMKSEGDSTRFSFALPPDFARYIAPKGGVCLDGISLTVNEVTGAEFGVNIIPHTKAHTSWQTARVGQNVNLEIDVVARYVARMIAA